MIISGGVIQQIIIIDPIASTDLYQRQFVFSPIKKNSKIINTWKKKEFELHSAFYLE